MKADQLDSLSTMLQESFGDASVILPDGVARPAHLADSQLDEEDWYAQWRAFQARIGYSPRANP